MRTRTWRTRCAATWMLSALLAACGGGGGGGTSEEPGPPPDPLPPAGSSRWAAIEGDSYADGTIDSVTRYSYDDQGRRVAERSYAVVDGVVAAEPSGERLWSFDRWSRITGTVYRNSAGGVVTTAYDYGADGRLAAQHTASDGSSTDTRFIWRDGRIVETRTSRTGSTGAVVYLFSYDENGRVSSVDLDPSAGEHHAGYGWRPDGRPSGASFYSGFTASYAYDYDADGRHVVTSFDDDGLYFEEARLAYDAQGRLVQVETGQPPDAGDFMPYFRTHYRWEPGPCQPLRMPGEPPHRASLMAGLISADNVSFGCAP